MGYQSNFLLLGNASCLNLGCEAILRGTVKILRSVFGNCRFVNANFDVIDPPFTPIESDPNVIHRPLPPLRKLTAKWVAVQTADRLYPPLGHHLRFRSLLKEITHSRATLSIGGDNYTLDYGIPWTYINLDRYVLARSKPLIIWGASVGPFDKKPDFARIVHEHLKNEVTAIFVREKRSYNYLVKHGISDNVHLMSDPAFLMEAKPVSSNKIGFEIPENAIGFNLSPLISHYIGDNKLATLTDIAINLLDAMNSKFHRPIILISHVTSPHSNDYELLREIYERLASKSPACVYLLPDSLDAAETKWVISSLSCLIAARTHATIAGFSACVPTVSLAYSVKAFGINEELFGHTDYVVRPEGFSVESITAKTGMVLARASEIKGILSNKMEHIRISALAAGTKLKELTGNYND
jgi:polysaccharide pyruvyl transferase WcaK-like protein